jgi:hypothetical protein
MNNFTLIGNSLVNLSKVNCISILQNKLVIGLEDGELEVIFANNEECDNKFVDICSRLLLKKE